MHPLTLVSALLVRYYFDLPVELFHLWYTRLDWMGRIDGLVIDTRYDPLTAIWFIECCFAGVWPIAAIEYNHPKGADNTRLWVWFNHE